MTRKVIDFPTQLPHFPTTHVYIGLLLFFLPLKVSTTCYHLLPLYQSVLLSFKTYYIQSFNLSKFKIFSLFFPLMAQDMVILSQTLSLQSFSRQVLLQHLILVAQSIDFSYISSNISISFILFSPTKIRFSLISF